LAGSECDFVTFPEDARLTPGNFRAVYLDKVSEVSSAFGAQMAHVFTYQR
jgi:hypothetical protein